MIRHTANFEKDPEKYGQNLQRSCDEARKHALEHGRCVDCGGKLAPWGSIKRIVRIKNPEDDGHVKIQVRERRVRCCTCHRTHVVVPPGLVPYKWYALGFILAVIAACLSDELTHEKICASCSIALSTLYRWLRTGKLHAKLVSILDADAILENTSRKCDQVFLRKFLARFGRIFLEHLRPSRKKKRKLPANACV